MLVTGGAGYVGSHTCKALFERGYWPVVYDDLSSSFREAARWGSFVEGDVRDTRALSQAILAHGATAIIHFASLIEVGRSVVQPDLFYDQNVVGSLSMLNAARNCGVERVVFSSTAAVYGATASVGRLTEDAPKVPTSPYGDTKLACERMMAAYCLAFGFSGVALRYFNAAGADPSGLIGEAHDPETHLIPLGIRAALGTSQRLTVYGNDFGTPDGTCVRDYVHVNDLAMGHVAALEAELPDRAFEAVNLASGRGYSVLEVIEAVERAVGRPVPRTIGPRRPGDPASLVADPSRAAALLGWMAQRSSIDEIVQDAVKWHRDQKFGQASIRM